MSWNKDIDSTFGQSSLCKKVLMFLSLSNS